MFPTMLQARAATTVSRGWSHALGRAAGVLLILAVFVSSSAAASTTEPVANPGCAQAPSGADGCWLYSVSAASRSDVWAVGFINAPADIPLTLHWNGSAWAQVPTPPLPLGYAGELLAASDVSTSDAWAVGELFPISQTTRSSPLILHWNGSSWQQVNIPASASPGSGRAGVSLVSVSAVSSNDVWALGACCSGPGHQQQSYILHWNGDSWTVKTLGEAADLTSIAAISAKRAWAVGGFSKNFMLRWDGSAWDHVAVPSPRDASSTLDGVSALSARAVWAVGAVAGGPPRGFHWNGHKWKTWKLRVSQVYAVDARAANSVWAVGAGAVLHWNGRRWKRVSNPTGDAVLESVTSPARNEAWTVGGTEILRCNRASCAVAYNLGP